MTRQDVCERFVASVRHSTRLNMQVLEALEDRVTVRMPYSEDLVGNPDTGVIHGGAIFTLIDQAGGLANCCRLFPEFELTPTIDMRVDHLRAPRPGRGILCYSHCYRLSEHVAFVSSRVFEEEAEGVPSDLGEIATCLATYMRMKLPGQSRSGEG